MTMRGGQHYLYIGKFLDLLWGNAHRVPSGNIANQFCEGNFRLSCGLYYFDIGPFSYANEICGHYSTHRMSYEFMPVEASFGEWKSSGILSQRS
jgi:hypothetical protein